MTLQQLHQVITIAESKSMNEAARKLFVSQPNLSSVVRELEEEAGITIFIRSNRGIVMTPEGEEFIGYAKQVVEQYHLLEKRYMNSETKKKFSVSMQHYSFAVKAFVETNDAMEVRKIQKNILFTYQKDISKHVPTREANRINMVWQSMPSQLVKENKKFIYGVAKPGARAKDFETAIQWLLDAGLVYKAERVNEPKMPLKFYVDISSFKLFLLDCGLLGAMSETPADKLLVAENGMEESKGAFTENYVMSQLIATNDTSVFYYSNDAKLEIDFLIQHDCDIVPIEAKAEENLRSKSLSTFVEQHSGLHGIRFSMSDYREQSWMTNVPLYAASIYF